MDADSGKRRYKRVRYRLPVGCIGPFNVFEGKIDNLSEDGVCLVVGERIEQGLLLSLIFRLPTRFDPLVVCSRVLWTMREGESEATRLGLQHLWLSRDDREALTRFLEALKDENEDWDPTPQKYLT